MKNYYVTRSGYFYCPSRSNPSGYDFYPSAELGVLYTQAEATAIAKKIDGAGITQYGSKEMKRTKLQISVLSQNMFNEFGAKCFKYESDFFTPLVGVDPFKVNGSLKQKYEHELLKFDGQRDGVNYNFHYWFSHNYGSLTMHCKLCISGGSHDDQSYFCEYTEQGYELMPYDQKTGFLLSRISGEPDFSKRYDAVELQALGNEVRAMAKRYDEELDKVPHYFRDVLWLQRLK